MVPAMSRPRIQGNAGMPKLYEMDFQSTGLRPTQVFETRVSDRERGVGGGWKGVSSKDRDQPWVHERTRRASVRPDGSCTATGQSGGVDGENEIEDDTEYDEARRGPSESSSSSAEDGDDGRSSASAGPCRVGARTARCFLSTSRSPNGATPLALASLLE